MKMGSHWGEIQQELVHLMYTRSTSRSTTTITTSVTNRIGSTCNSTTTMVYVFNIYADRRTFAFINPE